MEVFAAGATLEEVFVRAAEGVLALAVDPESVEGRDVREVRAHGRTPEALLAHWISECLYLQEVEGFVCRRLELAVFDTKPRPGGEPLRLHSIVHGEELDPARHHPKTSIKAAPPGGVSIRAIEGGYEARIMVET
jgi:SHS2 domain-containing protein